MKKVLVALGMLAVSKAESVYACAACYGQSDSPLARGMNWGILCLLVVITGVLGGVVAFFVHVGKKAADIERAAAGEPPATGK